MPNYYSYNINKPLLKDGRWYIFPKITFSRIETLDCNDAMKGKCYNTKTFDQCIEDCEKSHCSVKKWMNFEYL